MSIFYLIAADKPNGRHIPGDPNEVYWGSVAFFIVVGLVIWKVLPSIREQMAERTAKIEAELADAKAARAEAEQALNASSQELPDVSAEEARIREEAQATAAKLKDDLIARAEADAEAVRERGRADVANRKRQAQADLAAEVAEMTRGSARAVVLDGLDDSAQGDLIENYINQVSQMS
jgi:F-type H+-transporting ATPase subunit b